MHWTVTWAKYNIMWLQIKNNTKKQKCTRVRHKRNWCLLVGYLCYRSCSEAITGSWDAPKVALCYNKHTDKGEGGGGTWLFSASCFLLFSMALSFSIRALFSAVNTSILPCGRTQHNKVSEYILHTVVLFVNSFIWWKRKNKKSVLQTECLLSPSETRPKTAAPGRGLFWALRIYITSEIFQISVQQSSRLRSALLLCDGTMHTCNCKPR